MPDTVEIAADDSRANPSQTILTSSRCFGSTGPPSGRDNRFGGAPRRNKLVGWENPVLARPDRASTLGFFPKIWSRCGCVGVGVKAVVACVASRQLLTRYGLGGCRICCRSCTRTENQKTIAERSALPHLVDNQAAASLTPPASRIKRNQLITNFGTFEHLRAFGRRPL